MKLPTYDDIGKLIARKSYRFFEGKYDLNLIGIRSSDMRADTFNDWVIVVYRDQRDEPKIEWFEATTDAGLYYRLHPIRVEGTAIMAPGQHFGLWKKGLHHGTIPALVQVGDVTYYRDANRNDTLEYIGPLIKGKIGLNFHPANRTGTTVKVGKNSAACWNPAKASNVTRMRALMDLQERHGHGDTVSVTLIEEKDYVQVVK